MTKMIFSKLASVCAVALTAALMVSQPAKAGGDIYHEVDTIVGQGALIGGQVVQGVSLVGSTRRWWSL